MDRAAIVDRLDEERRHLARDGEIIEILHAITRLSGAAGTHHTIIYSRLDEADAEHVISREIDAHRIRNVPFEWKVFEHDKPADLRERLERRGFLVGPKEAVLALDLHQRPNWIEQTTTTDVIRVERLEQIEDFRHVAEAVFNKDYTLTATELADALRSGSSQHRGYIGYRDGKPVSIGRLYTHPQSWFGGLYGGGTVGEFRGQGMYRAIVAARAKDARALGARYLIVDALPTSRPILERLGFELLTHTWPCEWKP